MGFDIELKQGEAKTIKFTMTDASSNAVSLASTTVTFYMKRKKTSSSAIVTVSDLSFSKTSVASGVVTMPLSKSDTSQSEGLYYGELKTQFSASNIDKSDDIKIYIKGAVV